MTEVFSEWFWDDFSCASFFFTFHMHCVTVVRSLCFRIFLASFLITFLSPEIAASVSVYDGLFIVRDLFSRNHVLALHIYTLMVHQHLALSFMKWNYPGFVQPFINSLFLLLHVHLHLTASDLKLWVWFICNLSYLGWALVQLLLMQWKLQGSFVFVMVTLCVIAEFGLCWIVQH
jgi:hypothetical protein